MEIPPVANTCDTCTGAESSCEVEAESGIHEVQFEAVSLRNSDDENGMKNRIGRRNKCKSAAVLLGLDKSRKRKAAESSFVLPVGIDKDARNHAPKSSKVEKSSMLISDAFPKSVTVSSSSLVKLTESPLTSECFKFAGEAAQLEPREAHRSAGVIRECQFTSSSETLTHSVSSVIGSDKESNETVADVCYADNGHRMQKSDCDLNTDISSTNNELTFLNRRKKLPKLSSAQHSRAGSETLALSTNRVCNKGIHMRLKPSKDFPSKIKSAEVKRLNKESLVANSSVYSVSARRNTTVPTFLTTTSKTPAFVKQAVSKGLKKSSKRVFSIGAKEDVVEPENHVFQLTNEMTDESYSRSQALTSTVINKSSLSTILSAADTGSTHTSCLAKSSTKNHAGSASAANPVSSKLSYKSSVSRSSPSTNVLLSSNSSLLRTSMVSDIAPTITHGMNGKSMRRVSSLADSSSLPVENSDAGKSSSSVGIGINQWENESICIRWDSRRCGLDCAGRFGVPPSLHCEMCMSAFHPECVGFGYLAHKTGFTCRYCHQLRRELTGVKYSLKSQSSFASANNTASQTSASDHDVIKPADFNDVQHVSCISENHEVQSAVSDVHCKENQSREETNVLASTDKLLADGRTVISGSCDDDTKHVDDEHAHISGQLKDTGQILILPAAIQRLFNLSLAVELLCGDERVLLPQNCFQITEAELRVNLPGKTLKPEYLTGCDKPLVCEVFLDSSGHNQILKLTPFSGEI